MTKSETADPNRRRWLGDVALAFAVLLGIAAGIWFLVRPAPLPEGIDRENYDRAEREYRQTYHREPTRADVFFLMGESAWQQNHLEKALSCFRQISPQDPEYGAAVRAQEGEIHVELNRAEAGESCFREFLRLVEQGAEASVSDRVTAYKWLNFLLSVELRFEERKEFLEELHELGHANVFDSKQLYFPHLLIWRSSKGRERLAKFLENDPANPHLLIAQARYLTASGKIDEARALLENLQKKHPEKRYAIAALLECEFESGNQKNFFRIAESLPATEPGEPWLLTRMRGQYALETKRPKDAVRHFERVLEADPSNPESQMGLANAYRQMGQTGLQEKALSRSQVLAKIRVFLSNITENDANAALELASMCEEIELFEAARTYRNHAERIARSLDGSSASPFPAR